MRGLGSGLGGHTWASGAPVPDRAWACAAVRLWAQWASLRFPGGAGRSGRTVGTCGDPVDSGHTGAHPGRSGRNLTPLTSWGLRTVRPEEVWALGACGRPAASSNLGGVSGHVVACPGVGRHPGHDVSANTTQPNLTPFGHRGRIPTARGPTGVGLGHAADENPTKSHLKNLRALCGERHASRGEGRARRFVW